MKRNELGLLLVHAICCGLPLLVVLGISLAPLVAAFVATQWHWLVVGIAVLVVGGLAWRRRRRQAGCTNNLCSPPAQSLQPHRSTRAGDREPA